MAVALAIDWVIGWPDALTRRIGHPVIWIGRLISRLEAAWNTPGVPQRDARRAGRSASLVVISLTIGIAGLLQVFVPDTLLGSAILGVLAWPLVAAHSLRSHVADIARPLLDGNLSEARSAVARIVGRDPNTLDEAGMSRAAIESLAENTSDGVTAPLFWGALLGLPGIAGYKAINTLDSLIGYRNLCYRDFGRFAARLDDVANWGPARLTGLLICLTSDTRWESWRVMRRDAHRHRSPNAGWPEAAMAGALDVRLSGPRVYDTGGTSDPWLNGGARDPSGTDIVRAIDVFSRSTVAIGVVLVGWALL